LLKHSNIYKMSYSIRDVFHSLDLMEVLAEQAKPKNSADLKVN